MDWEELIKKKKKTDYILVALIGTSLLLLLYSIIYLFNYYTNIDILVHYPKTVDNTGETLNPNEIGDSIGGILNPIIGLSASVLTFLAFYIQFKANKEQREFFFIGLSKEKVKNEAEKTEEKLREKKAHKSNVQIFKILIDSMLNYYTKSGEQLKIFIDKEKANPLSMNEFSFITNSSYENFQKLDLRDLYNSVLFSFEDKDIKWEKDFVNLLTTIDFYEKLINDIKSKYEYHAKTKSDNLNAVGQRLNGKIGEVMINPNLNTLDGVNDYLAIVYNRTPANQPIIPDEQFKGSDFGKLQDVFLFKILRSLKAKFDQTGEEIYSEYLDFFSVNNKDVGAEKFQTEHYVENLTKKYDSYLTEENENLKSIKNFLRCSFIYLL
jgi:hypothetical protein